jgi:hypothetical protein
MKLLIRVGRILNNCFLKKIGIRLTTGKRTIAVRQNVCRALFVGRTANGVFAVRFPDDARQTKTHGIHILCRASLRGRTAITNLCRAFS